jgi:hypothetical protein
MLTLKQLLKAMSSIAGPGLVLSMAVLLGASCTCSPGDTPIEADCPNGKNAASTISVQYSLEGLNDPGVDKQIRVSGNRSTTPAQHQCYADGSLGSFPSKQYVGQGSGTDTIANLQDGNWELRVQQVGGASSPPPAQIVTGILPPGSSRTLVITNGPGGVLKVTF